MEMGRVTEGDMFLAIGLKGFVFRFGGFLDFFLELAEVGFLGPFGAIYAPAEAFGGIAGALLAFRGKRH